MIQFETLMQLSHLFFLLWTTCGRALKCFSNVFRAVKFATCWAIQKSHFFLHGNSSSWKEVVRVFPENSKLIFYHNSDDENDWICKGQKPFWFLGVHLWICFKDGFDASFVLNDYRGTNNMLRPAACRVLQVKVNSIRNMWIWMYDYIWMVFM